MSGAGLDGIEVLASTRSEYRTSFPIDLLEVDLPGRGRSMIVAKRLDREDLDANARLAKPLFLHVAGREPYVYERLLPRGPAGPPLFLGAEQGADGTRLYIEWIEGRVLFEVGERRIWEEVAAWLGRFHSAFEGAADLPAGAPLVDRDADFHRRWLVRARDFARSRPGADLALDWLGTRHEGVVEALSTMDRTLLHGEFYAANVLVVGGGRVTRIAPVDWELAGPGPGALDLAALVCGWPAVDRDAMRRAYGAGRGCELSARALDLARLQVAIQWLGWAPPGWTPPADQRRDWAAEAIEIAEELEL
jgi:Ser/Thr protein kinase RdoA (MazF antagonist)